MGLPKTASGDWLTGLGSKTVIAALTAKGAQVRFVGGCVRNALLGEPVTDIDLATPEDPETVTRLLEDAGIRAVPSGIEHGTVTAVLEARHFEITTLRHDVETFGRKAEVAFHADWEADAQRRDFTMNALYADPDGTVFDPLGGYADLAARRLRFIGDAGERIREDYLRILRFFRIHAWYGRGALDSDGLAATKTHLAGLDHLSAERVRDELFKLLAASGAASVLQAMDDAGVLAHVLPEATKINRYAACVGLEKSMRAEADPLRRLAALVDAGEQEASEIGQRLKLSNKQTVRLRAMKADLPDIGARTGKKALRRALYWHGAAFVTDRLFIAWAGGRGDSKSKSWRAVLKAARAWEAPRFPVSGLDVMALGVPKGVEVGKTLRALEAWWVDTGFPAEEKLRARLDAMVRTEP